MKYQHHLAAGFCGFVLLSGTISTTAAETSHSWNAFETDFNALGLAAINLTFEVKAPGSETFKIAARTRDTRIDAFVFGKAGGKFTDAQLDAVVIQNPAAKVANWPKPWSSHPQTRTSLRNLPGKARRTRT